MKKKISFLILMMLSSVIWLPFLMLIGNSFMGASELMSHFSAVLSGTGGEVEFSLLPQYPTLKPYVELLFDSPGFYVMFWNSVKIVFSILGGSLLISVPAAWAFGRYDFYGKKWIFIVYMILMIMPFQVTMVSGYLVLDRLHMMDSHLAVILPAVFSTFPVFIMSKFFQAIPPSLIEAAKIDGAAEWSIFLRIGMPLGFPGIMSALILSFLEHWNAIEAPMTFLRNQNLWPLSLYLPEITAKKAGVAFAASVISLLPPLLLFLMGQSHLEQGIEASGIKE